MPSPEDIGAAAPSPHGVRLIASDLDNTLLHTDKSVSPRTRAAIEGARAAGILVVPVTARQTAGIDAVLGWQDWAVCSNGAFVAHMGTGERLVEAMMEPADQRHVLDAMTAAVPGLKFCAVRDGGDGFFVEPGYAELSVWSDHNRDPRAMVVTDHAGLAAEPNLKMVARHTEIAPRELLTVFEGLDLPGVQATSSGAPFLEISRSGVGKAYGLSRLCERLSIPAEQVVALGDGLNDIDMLTWAGHGVAVANAQPEVAAIADEVTAHCDDDGFAQVVERLVS